MTLTYLTISLPLIHFQDIWSKFYISFLQFINQKQWFGGLFFCRNIFHPNNHQTPHPQTITSIWLLIVLSFFNPHFIPQMSSIRKPWIKQIHLAMTGSILTFPWKHGSSSKTYGHHDVLIFLPFSFIFCLTLSFWLSPPFPSSFMLQPASSRFYK